MCVCFFLFFWGFFFFWGGGQTKQRNQVAVSDSTTQTEVLSKMSNSAPTYSARPKGGACSKPPFHPTSPTPQNTVFPNFFTNHPIRHITSLHDHHGISPTRDFSKSCTTTTTTTTTITKQEKGLSDGGPEPGRYRPRERHPIGSQMLGLGP